MTQDRDKRGPVIALLAVTNSTKSAFKSVVTAQASLHGYRLRLV